MGVFGWLIDHIAPIFLITSPITSYADQIYSIHRTRTSAGFSLDIPLIMLVASILKIFYWFGVHFDRALLIQAIVMIIMQSLLLHVALTHRPISPSSQPFQSVNSSEFDIPRPYNFWRWRTAHPYWSFLGYFTITLIAMQLLFGSFDGYADLLGYIALGIEALLPIPQILANHRRRGCKGFRLSVLANWLVGDCFKMVFFFAKGSGDVPWAFKICGVFQAACDLFLGIQFYAYGDGEPGSEGRDIKKDLNWLGEKGMELVGWESGQQ
ncbi:hypothetical protein BT63DRAFT_419137 [Microthyrium microscopicum]|uniref:PQ loop repeat protein n=1 Tax=Microthyrium microscopicum TaxID=703497 RepID=A0A6A6TU17_9PEZI|nr:hypothetical protein BT63DRAFT_419137 [Microthyrium microscopicum]